MNGAFYIGATGLQAQQRALDVVANNVANMNTTAFKRSEVRFSELVGQPSVSDAALAHSAPLLGGVRSFDAPRVQEQGELRETGKDYDVAISGAGFIELLGPGGQTYLWRGGTLRVNPDGLLASEGGLSLKALIEMPTGATNLVIDREGRVTATLGDGNETLELGVISLALPEDMSAVEPVGGGYFAATDDEGLVALSPGESGAGALVQGSLESSNVEMTTEMVTLLLMQRAYAANAQVIQAGDQLMAIANGLRR